MEINNLTQQLFQTRNELKNIRHQLVSLKSLHQKDVQKLKLALEEKVASLTSGQLPRESRHPNTVCQEPHFRPIGYISSVFKHKNATPRQANICGQSRAKLVLRKDLFSNPAHSLDGLHEFSHVWLLFVFHKNNNAHSKAKVAPPRLDGARVGVFSTRSPYRPNPIGLSLVQLDQLQGSTLCLSGVDLLDGTPVLDIKPYIPSYDFSHTVHSTPTDLLASDQQDSLTPTRAEPQDLQQQSHTIHPAAADILLASDQQDTLTPTRAEPRDLQQHSESPAPSNDCSSESTASTDDIESTSSHKHLESSTSQEHLGPSPDRHRQATERSGPCDQVCDPPSQTLSRETSSNPFATSHATPIEADRTTPVATYPDWIRTPPIPKLTVLFTERARENLSRLFVDKSCTSTSTSVCLETEDKVKDVIVSILGADPRSTYRRQHCQDRLYYFDVDNFHVTCWFDETNVEVLKVKLLSGVAENTSKCGSDETLNC